MNDQDTFEEWKTIPGPYNDYLVSNLGRVKSLKTKRVLSPGLASNGYYTVALCSNGKCVTKTVHSLVANIFLGKGKYGQVVNHKDSDRTNNMVSNLEWVTPKENLEHAVNKGHFPGRKRREIVCLETGEIFSSINSAARAKNVSRPNILRAVKSGIAAGGFHWASPGKSIKLPKKKKWPVKCVETGVVYRNISEASKATGAKNIYLIVSGKRKTAGKYHWERVVPQVFRKVISDKV